MSDDIRVEREIAKLNETVKTCQMVEDTLNTLGWATVIEPLIDKTIMDITGGKIDRRWYGGALDRARKDERREYYIGYKQALIDFHTRIHAYPLNIKNLQDKQKELIDGKSQRYTRPMIDDTRYGRDLQSDIP